MSVGVDGDVCSPRVHVGFLQFLGWLPQLHLGVNEWASMCV